MRNCILRNKSAKLSPFNSVLKYICGFYCIILSYEIFPFLICTFCSIACSTFISPSFLVWSQSTSLLCV